jgi:hypothetical protein
MLRFVKEESGRAVAVCDLALEAADHGSGERAAIGLYATGEALRIKPLEQRAEGVRITVVRRGRRERRCSECGASVRTAIVRRVSVL